MKTATKRALPRHPRKHQALRAKIARFSNQFMLKVGEPGFDAVAELVKSRRTS